MITTIKSPIQNSKKYFEIFDYDSESDQLQNIFLHFNQTLIATDKMMKNKCGMDT